MRRALTCLACAGAVFWQASTARADAGVWDVGATGMWVSTAQAQLAAAANLGLADAWAWHSEAGLRFNEASLVRPMVATGVTWVYDVLSYVPAATVAAGLVYPDAQASWLALGRLELRRFVTPHAWGSIIAGVELTRAGWAAQVGLGFSWQWEGTGAS